MRIRGYVGLWEQFISICCDKPQLLLIVGDILTQLQFNFFPVLLFLWPTLIFWTPVLSPGNNFPDGELGLRSVPHWYVMALQHALYCNSIEVRECVNTLCLSEVLVGELTLPTCHLIPNLHPRILYPLSDNDADGNASDGQTTGGSPLFQCPSMRSHPSCIGPALLKAVFSPTVSLSFCVKPILPTWGYLYHACINTFHFLLN